MFLEKKTHFHIITNPSYYIIYLSSQLNCYKVVEYRVNVFRVKPVPIGIIYFLRKFEYNGCVLRSQRRFNNLYSCILHINYVRGL